MGPMVYCAVVTSLGEQ